MGEINLRNYGNGEISISPEFRVDFLSFNSMDTNINNNARH